MTGLIGFASGYYAMNDCDALLMLGTDFSYRQFYPQGSARIGQIDIRPEQIGRRAPVTIGLVGDVAVTLDALLPLLPEARSPAPGQGAGADGSVSCRGLPAARSSRLLRVRR